MTDDEYWVDYARRTPCVRSGFCCKQVTCAMGMFHGSEGSGRKGNGKTCDFLRGDKPGEYRCGLAEDGRISADGHEVGGFGPDSGCSSTLFNEDRNTVLRARRVSASARRGDE